MSRAATDKPRTLAAIAAGLALFAGLLQPTLAQDGIERAGYFEVRSASTRQVGGPSNSSCLNNTQQAGEGWSDWLALVYTAEASDQGGDARGIGLPSSSRYMSLVAAAGATSR